MLESLEKLVRTLCKWFAWIASAALAGIMVLTFVDVIGRFFGHPLGVAVDITELAMGLIVFTGIALTTLQRGHITVDLVTTNVPKPVARLLDILGLVASVFFMGLIAWQLWTRTADHYVNNARTIVKEWPIYPTTFLMAAGTTLAVVTAVIVLILVIAGKQSAQSSNPAHLD